jgi:putative phosphoesterase
MTFSTRKWYETNRIDDIDMLYVISDIHANLPALTAVMDKIPDQSKIICAGDIVGYYTEPNAVCELLRARDVACIVGNHDLYVLNKLNYAQSNETKYRVHWTREHLTKNNLNWLQQLPETRTFKKQTNINNKCMQNISVHHGSMLNIEEYIYPNTPIDHLTLADNTITVLGHTHHPMIRDKDSGACILNPGSVGQPRDRNPAASYAIINFKTQSITIKRVSYDVPKYQKKLEQLNLTHAAIHILSRTVNEQS